MGAVVTVLCPVFAIMADFRPDDVNIRDVYYWE